MYMSWRYLAGALALIKATIANSKGRLFMRDVAEADLSPILGTYHFKWL